MVDMKSLLKGLVANYCKFSFGGLVWGFWGGLFFSFGGGGNFFAAQLLCQPRTSERREMATAQWQGCLIAGSWLELSQ